MANNYGMIRVEGLKQGAVAGRAIHHTRDYNKDREAPDHIDSKLSKDNLYVGESGKPTKKEKYSQFMARLREREKEHKKTTGRSVRKDANRCADLVFARSDLGDNEKNFDNKKWFQDTVKWVGERFGKDSIVGGSLHMDEPDRLTGKVHPHIHVMITPTVETEKGKKLSFDKVFKLGTYSELQTEYYENVGKLHGLARGEKRERSLTHVSTKEFKNRTLKAEKKLLENVRKVIHKKPEQALEYFEQLAYWYAPSEAGKDILLERIKKPFLEREKKLQESLESANARTKKTEKELSKMRAENKNLSKDIEGIKPTLKRLMETLAYGSDETIKEMGEACIDALKQAGQKRPKVLDKEQVREDFKSDRKSGRGVYQDEGISR